MSSSIREQFADLLRAPPANDLTPPPVLPTVIEMPGATAPSAVPSAVAKATTRAAAPSTWRNRIVALAAMVVVGILLYLLYKQWWAPETSAEGAGNASLDDADVEVGEDDDDDDEYRDGEDGEDGEDEDEEGDEHVEEDEEAEASEDGEESEVELMDEGLDTIDEEPRATSGADPLLQRIDMARHLPPKHGKQNKDGNPAQKRARGGKKGK